MGNRSSPHLHPGQRNLRGKTTMSVCPCCDPIRNYRDKVRRALDDLAMRNPDDFSEPYPDPNTP